jgi:adenosylcobinamide amidohydrolase
MDSFRLAQDTVQGVDVAVLVTSGLSNARRVGDLAEYRQMSAAPEKAGTINIIVLTSACLTDAAMVEVLMMVTEAKSAVLQEAGVLSPVSRKIATGTGTDSVAVVSGKGCEQVNFAGKHVLFGEVLGRLVVQALSSAVTWELENGSNVS